MAVNKLISTNLALLLLLKMNDEKSGKEKEFKLLRKMGSILDEER
jgi:hypothetical protein